MPSGGRYQKYRIRSDRSESEFPVCRIRLRTYYPLASLNRNLCAPRTKAKRLYSLALPFQSKPHTLETSSYRDWRRRFFGGETCPIVGVDIPAMETLPSGRTHKKRTLHQLPTQIKVIPNVG